MGNTVYLTTLDAHLIAVDASTGKQRWDTKVADPKDDYTMTGAPLALADRVIVGMAGGEFGARGFLAAFDAKDGKLLWKFYTIPGPGEPGHETWTGEAWKTGGGPTWTAGAYDAERDLVIWGVGNPAPEYNAAVRPGDNLYTNSVIALKGDTGRLQWHYQFTPNDDHDWDAVQQPILAEIPFKGGARPVVLWANRNAFFYAIDRTDGTFLYAKPFVKQNWNEGFDERGRPKMSLSARGSATGSLVWPTVGGATNWWPPSYDRQRGLVYVPTVEAASLYFQGKVTGHVSGEWYGGSSATYAADQPAAAFIKAISAETGDVRWTRTLEKGAEGVLRIVGGVLSTRGGLVFSGHRERFFALDADTGEELWSVPLGARISGPPVSFEVAGRQYVAVAAGNSLFAFSLPSHRLP
jgi:alcohol dehydrogenase (cytochrome c)